MNAERVIRRGFGKYIVNASLSISPPSPRSPLPALPLPTMCTRARFSKGSYTSHPTQRSANDPKHPKRLLLSNQQRTEYIASSIDYVPAAHT